MTKRVVLQVLVVGSCMGFVQSQANDSPQDWIDRAWTACTAVPTMTCIYLEESIVDARLLQQGMPFRKYRCPLYRKPGWASIARQETPVAAWSAIAFGSEPSWQWVRGPQRSEWFDGSTGRLAIRWMPASPPADGKAIPPLHGDPEFRHPVYAPWAAFTRTGSWGETSQVRLGMFTAIATGKGKAPQTTSWRLAEVTAKTVALETGFGSEGVSRDQLVVIKRKPGDKPLYRSRVTLTITDGPPRITREEKIPDDDRIDTIRHDFTYRIHGQAAILEGAVSTIQPSGLVVGRVTTESLDIDHVPPDSAFHIDPSQAKTVYDETARMAIDVPAP